MFDNEIYSKAQVVLDEIHDLDKKTQTLPEGTFIQTIEVVSSLMASLRELLNCKGPGGEVEKSKEEKFFKENGSSLARNLGLTMGIFEGNISLDKALFDFLKVFKRV